MTRKSRRVQDAMAKGQVVDADPPAGSADDAAGGRDSADGPPEDDVDIERLDAPEDLLEEERSIAQACARLDQNDRDNGRRLVAWYGHGLRYVTGLGWLVWRGTHWQRDEADLEVRYLSQQIVDKIKIEAFEIEATDGQRTVLRAYERLVDSKKN